MSETPEDLSFVPDDALIAELGRRWESTIIALDRIDSKSVQDDRAKTNGSFRIITTGSIAARIGLARLVMRHEEQEVESALNGTSDD